MRTTASWAKLALASAAVAILAIATTGSQAQAGHKCPDRYFKKQKLTGVDPKDEDAAKKAYTDGVPGKAKEFESDCDNCECEEKGEKCTYRYKYKKKPDCEPNKKKNIIECVGWVRPGCFCEEKDEAQGD
jgi:hypothetical protein